MGPLGTIGYLGRSLLCSFLAVLVVSRSGSGATCCSPMTEEKKVSCWGWLSFRPNAPSNNVETRCTVHKGEEHLWSEPSSAPLGESAGPLEPLCRQLASFHDDADLVRRIDDVFDLIDSKNTGLVSFDQLRANITKSPGCADLCLTQEQFNELFDVWRYVTLPAILYRHNPH